MADYPILREAFVTSVEDPEKLGRIQLRVIPELSDHDEKDLPWCFPESSGIHGKSFGMPLVGQLVSCIVWTKFWCEITYLPMVIKSPTTNLYSEWMDSIKSNIEDMASDPEEKDLVVTQFSDNFNFFHDTKNNEHGFYHPSGTYVTINKDGSIFLKGKKELKIHDGDGNLQLSIDFSSGNISLETKGDYSQEFNGGWKITVNGDASIESKGSVKLKASASCTIESSSDVTIKSAQCVVDSQILNFKGTKSQGTVPPSGSGVLCGVPACICSGAPHVG